MTKTSGESSEKTDAPAIRQSGEKKEEFSGMHKIRTSQDKRVVGITEGMDDDGDEFLAQREQATTVEDLFQDAQAGATPVEKLEEEARAKSIKNPFALSTLGFWAALKIMILYLLTLETVLTCCLTAGLTAYWYYEDAQYQNKTGWDGGGMDFVLLGFAVTTPLSAAIGMAFTRREDALLSISEFRGSCYQLYLAHSLWVWKKWNTAGDRDTLLEHCDALLAQLIGIGDELARFLSLPTSSRGRHRMTILGRREARTTMIAAYRLFASYGTRRLACVNAYGEKMKDLGLSGSEATRIHSYERHISISLEKLRNTKMYRTPQALRSFVRVFTILMPPFYAPTFAQLSYDLGSVGYGLAFGIFTALGLSALFESLEVLEDPFVAYVTLDGINVQEELEVLHYLQLVNARKLIFPDASPYPLGRRAALTGNQGRVGEILLPDPKALSDESRGVAASSGSKADQPKQLAGAPIEEQEHGQKRRYSVFKSSIFKRRPRVNR